MGDCAVRLRIKLVPLLVWLLAFLLAFACFPITTQADETVTATKYSCDPDPRNAMTTTPGMCITTASGTDPSTVGAACPYEWAGWWLWIEGEGVFRCDDTSSKSGELWLGRHHIDMRVATFDEAFEFGIQQRKVKRVFYSYRAPINHSAKKGRGPL